MMLPGIAFVCAWLQGPPQVDPTMIDFTQGDLPIVITAPHGGRLRVPGAEVRTGQSIKKNPADKTKFTTVLDTDTDKLAAAIADAVEKKLHARPFVIIAHFSRKYVDANRPMEDGTESEAGRALYKQYHDAVLYARTTIIKKWGTGLLIDVHGQGTDRNVIFRGTGNGDTVKHAVQTYGRDAIYGPHGLLGVFVASGAVLSPTNDDLISKENPALNGGWTVRRYGSGGMSSLGGPFDAIQLETGMSYRRENLGKTATGLAEALVAYAQQYLLTNAATKASGR